MPDFEQRFPCPVCLGVQMTKIKLTANTALQLDYCPRCGGMWFDRGEVQQLRQCQPRALQRKITLKAEAYQMQCHSCQSFMNRNAPKCPQCGWKNVIDCPGCGNPLKPLEYEGMKLDICKRCKGVWFDSIELSELWNLNVEALANRRRKLGGKAGDFPEDADLFLNVLLLSPDVMVGGAYLLGEAGRVLGEAAGSLGNAPELAGDLLESSGDLAGSVFGAIAEIINEIFS